MLSLGGESGYFAGACFVVLGIVLPHAWNYLIMQAVQEYLHLDRETISSTSLPLIIDEERFRRHILSYFNSSK